MLFEFLVVDLPRILIRCLNHLSWFPSAWKSSGSTPSSLQMSTAEPNHPTKDSLYPQSHLFVFHPEFVTIGKGWNVDQLVNWKLLLPVLCSRHDSDTPHQSAGQCLSTRDWSVSLNWQKWSWNKSDQGLFDAVFWEPCRRRGWICCTALKGSDSQPTDVSSWQRWVLRLKEIADLSTRINHRACWQTVPNSTSKEAALCMTITSLDGNAKCPFFSVWCKTMIQ